MSDDEVEVVGVYIPNDESIDDFFSLKNSDKLKVIQLGMEFFKQGNTKIQYWNNKDWEDKINDIERKHKGLSDNNNIIIDSLNSQINTLKKDFITQKRNLQESIENDFDTRYKKQLADLKLQQQELREQRDKWNEKYNSLYKELDDKFQSRLLDERTRNESIVKYYESTTRRF